MVNLPLELAYDKQFQISICSQNRTFGGLILGEPLSGYLFWSCQEVQVTHLCQLFCWVFAFLGFLASAPHRTLDQWSQSFSRCQNLMVEPGLREVKREGVERSTVKMQKAGPHLQSFQFPGGLGWGPITR